MEGLHVLQLEIRNTGPIRAMLLEPEGFTVLTGTNGAGKSSALNSLLYALTGKGFERPVRVGSAKSEVRVLLGRDGTVFCRVECVTTESGSRQLKVFDSGGKPVGKAQTFLNGLMGAGLAFDPVRLLVMKPIDQFAELRSILGLEEKWAKLQAEYKDAFDHRAVVKREEKRTEDRFLAMPKPAADCPQEILNTAELTSTLEMHLAKQADARKAKAEYDAQVVQVQIAEKNLESGRAVIFQIEAKIEELKAKLVQAYQEERDRSKTLELAKESALERRKAIPTDEQIQAYAVGAEAVRAKIKDAENYNRRFREARDYESMENALNLQKMDVQKAEDAVASASQRKKDLMREANVPVPGLEMTEDGISLNGIPLSQLSTGEMTRVVCTIAAAAEPALKVLVIREGALMTRENLRAVANAARDHGYQVIVEVFREDPGEEGVHIVEGEVTHIDGVSLCGEL